MLDDSGMPWNPDCGLAPEFDPDDVALAAVDAIDATNLDRDLPPGAGAQSEAGERHRRWTLVAGLALGEQWEGLGAEADAGLLEGAAGEAFAQDGEQGLGGRARGRSPVVGERNHTRRQFGDP